MKNTLLLALVCIALGFSAGWLAKPDTAATDVDNAQKSAKYHPKSTTPSTTKNTNPRTRHRKHSEMKSASSNDKLDPETKKRIEKSKERQKKMVRDQLKKKFDLKIASMVKELGLDATQEKALRDFYDQQIDLISSSDPFENMNAPESMKELAAAIRGDGLNDYMKDYLSEEQIEGLDTFQKRQKKNKIEGKAMKDLSSIQQILDLSDDQRDSVYNILVEDAEKSITTQSDANVVVDSMMKTMGMDIDMGDIDMGSIMALESNANKDNIDPSSIIAQMKEDRAKKIDSKVERMATILNEDQLKQYRNHLDSKGGMFNMMIQGMEQSEK